MAGSVICTSWTLKRAYGGRWRLLGGCQCKEEEKEEEQEEEEEEKIGLLIFLFIQVSRGALVNCSGLESNRGRGERR